jgi:hypothetical protein
MSGKVERMESAARADTAREDIVTQAHAELDRVAIPRVDEEEHTPLGLRERIAILALRYGRLVGRSQPFAEHRKPPFEIGETVATTKDLGVGPQGMLGELEGLREQGGVWLAEVSWSNGAESDGIDCGLLTRYEPSPDDRKPEPYPPWKGSEPADGTRRALLRDVIRDLSRKTDGNATPLMLADVIEEALLSNTINGEDKGAPEFSQELETMVGPDGAFVSIPSLLDLLGDLRGAAEARYAEAHEELPVESLEQAEAAEKADDAPQGEYFGLGTEDGVEDPDEPGDIPAVIVSAAATELLRRIESGEITSQALIFAVGRLS